MTRRHSKQMNDARVLAFAADDKFYWTGVPCKRGHLAKRRTDNASCTACKREYDVRWEERNPEAHYAINQRAAAKHKSKLEAALCDPADLEPEPPRRPSRQQRSL